MVHYPDEIEYSERYQETVLLVFLKHSRCLCGLLVDCTL